MEKCQVCGGSDFAPFTKEGEHEWLRCRDCDFVFLAQMPSLNEATLMQDDDMGNSYINGYRKKFDNKMRRSRRRVRALKKRMAGPRLLDIGSNIGCLVGAAQEIGLAASGIELNPRLVEFANETFPGCRFTCGALESVEHEGDLFDGIYCSEVIEHAVDVNVFMAAIASRLKPGGVLFLTTPHIREYRRWGRQPLSTEMKAPDHKLYFSNGNLSRLLTSHGFDHIKFQFNFNRGIKLFAAKV